MSSTLLSEASLQGLMSRWKRLGAPIGEALGPGLHEDEVLSLTEPLGIHLPAEAMTWWRWRNGVDSSDPASQFVGASFVYLSLQGACKKFLEMRALAVKAATAGRDADWWWSPSWLPIAYNLYGGLVIAGDCQGSRQETLPIHAVEWATMEDTFRVPREDSFGGLVHRWSDAMDSGAWTFDRAERKWSRRYERLTQEQDLSRLV